MKTTILLSGLILGVLADDPYSVDKIIPIAIVSSICIVMGGIFVLWLISCVRKRLRQGQHLQRIKAKSKNKIAPQPFPIPMDQPTIQQIKSKELENCIICLEPMIRKDIIVKPCGHWEFHEACFKQWVTCARSSALRDRCCRCTVQIHSYSRVYNEGQKIKKRSPKPHPAQIIADHP